MTTDSWIDRVRAAVLTASGESAEDGIRTAVRAGTELGAVGEQLSAAACIAARGAGLSWPEIIKIAQESRAPKPVRDSDIEAAEMFASKMWRALAAASALATSRGHDAVRGADLWSGMLTVREGSAATIVTVLRGPKPVADALQELEGTNARPEQQLIDGPPIFDANGGAGVPSCSDEARVLIDAGVGVSRSMAHDFVGTEHLMLAMLDDKGPDWVGKADVGLSFAEVRTELVAMLEASGMKCEIVQDDAAPVTTGGGR